MINCKSGKVIIHRYAVNDFWLYFYLPEDSEDISYVRRISNPEERPEEILPNYWKPNRLYNMTITPYPDQVQ